MDRILIIGPQSFIFMDKSPIFGPQCLQSVIIILKSSPAPPPPPPRRPPDGRAAGTGGGRDGPIHGRDRAAAGAQNRTGFIRLKIVSCGSSYLFIGTSSYLNGLEESVVSSNLFGNG